MQGDTWGRGREMTRRFKTGRETNKPREGERYTPVRFKTCMKTCRH